MGNFEEEMLERKKYANIMGELKKINEGLNKALDEYSDGYKKSRAKIKELEKTIMFLEADKKDLQFDLTCAQELASQLPDVLFCEALAVAALEKQPCICTSTSEGGYSTKGSDHEIIPIICVRCKVLQMIKDKKDKNES